MVSRLRPGIEHVESEPLIAADWALITNPRHPLAQRESVSLLELSDVQWVVPAGGSAFRRQMETVFATAGAEWPVRGIATNSILAIKSIVMNTDGVTMMSPALVDVERRAGRLHAVQLKDVAPMLPVGMMWRSGDELAPIAARFAKVLRQTAAEINQA